MVITSVVRIAGFSVLIVTGFFPGGSATPRLGDGSGTALSVSAEQEPFRDRVVSVDGSIEGGGDGLRSTTNGEEHDIRTAPFRETAVPGAMRVERVKEPGSFALLGLGILALLLLGRVGRRR